MTTSKKPFAWNKENTAQAIEMYVAMLENPEKGVVFANTDGLKEIGVEIGQTSIMSIRGKLIAGNVYKKADTPRKIGGGSAIRKAHFVRVFTKHAIEGEATTDDDALLSLESAKLDTLEILANMLGLMDEVKESAEV